jgi:hypothetical protein
LPLVEGGAVGGLGPSDLVELGIEAIAVDVLELAAGPGLERVTALGGLRRFLAWDGPILGIARVAMDEPGAETSGWRGRALPRLLYGQAGHLQLRSAVNGTILAIELSELAAWTEASGAWPSGQFGRGGPIFTYWQEPTLGAPPGELVVTPLTQELAHRGLYWSGDGWRELELLAPPMPRSLLEGCPCRTCAEATPQLLLHLWRSREITAELLLARHNLHWLQLIVAERPPLALQQLGERR